MDDEGERRRSGMVEGAGVSLSYEERGEGAPVLLIHDIGSDARALEPLAAALADRARAIVYDRRGYGASEAPMPYVTTTVNEQAEDAAALLQELEAAGAVVCGIGFGALIAIDLLLRHRDKVAGAVLAEPPLYVFDPDAALLLSAERASLEQALRAGGPERAIAGLLAGRRGDDELDRAIAASAAVFADLAGLATLTVRRASLRAIDAAVVVQTQPRSPSPVVVAADALADLLPAARREHEVDVARAATALLVP